MGGIPGPERKGPNGVCVHGHVSVGEVSGGTNRKLSLRALWMAPWMAVCNSATLPVAGR